MNSFVLQRQPEARKNTHVFIETALPRGLALFLGGFSLLNTFASLHGSSFDANLWWIDLRFLPESIAQILLLGSGISLLAFCLCPPRSRWRFWLTLAYSAVLAFIAVINTVQFYLLLALGRISSRFPLAFSLFVVLALLLILHATLRASAVLEISPSRFAALREQRGPERCLLPLLLWRRGPGRGGRGSRSLTRFTQRAVTHELPPARPLPILCVCFGCLLIVPVLQMFCFGKTDYRRPADLAVVLGARAYADGRPSDALADRVRTACRLYHAGLAKKLLFSGGPGDGPVHETVAMQRMAVALGVKPDDILLDPGGLNTQATVRNTESLFPRLHASRILVVSHFYHLPRIKLTYQRTGWEVYTVPAKESYLLRQLPYNMAREIAATWVYYLRTLANQA